MGCWWRALGDPQVPVTVGNEADLAALAECHRGAGRGASDVVYLSSDVGVGGGVIVGGRPLAGARGYAGEVGHMPVNPLGVRCRCGGRGCWETEVASEAVVRRAAARGLRARSASAVLASASAGDAQAREVVDEIARWAGRGLAAVVNIFNPERVVLGGLLAEVRRLAGDALRATFAEHALACAGDAVEVVAGALGDRAQLLGAAESVFTPLLEDPTTVPHVLEPVGRGIDDALAPTADEGGG